MKQKGYRMVRYADDFVVLVPQCWKKPKRRWRR